MKAAHADVVVIGAGIVGASCAYHLARRGLRVVVLEREAAPARGSSGLSAAGVRVQFTTESNIRLSKLSLEVYRDFPARHGREVGYRPIGYLLLVPRDRWASHLKAVALQREVGVPVDVVDPEAAQGWVAFDPDGVEGATFGPIDGVVDPHMATHAFVGLAREAGATFALSTPALEIRQCPAGWRVETTAGGVTAAHVVNAAGAWSGVVAERAGLALPVEPVRRHVYLSAPLDAARTLPLTIDLETGFWLRSEGRRILFGLSNQAQAPGFVQGMDEPWLEQVLLTGASRFPWLEDLGVDVDSSWWGYYEVTPDHNPIIGRHPGAEGWIDAAGFSGHGICHAPATGLLVSELVVDGVAGSVDISPYRHARFGERGLHEANII